MAKQVVQKKQVKKTKSDKTVMIWDKQFDRLSKYILKKFGYTVEVDSTLFFGIIDFEKQHISIRQTHKKELMTYLLLHEIGHVLYKNKKKEYKNIVEDALQIVSKSSLSFRMIVVYEEIQAWNEGLYLGKKLSLPIDRKTFETYKSRCLKTYMSWAMDHKKNRTSKIVQLIEEKNLTEKDHVHYEIINDEMDLKNEPNNNYDDDSNNSASRETKTQFSAEKEKNKQS